MVRKSIIISLFFLQYLLMFQSGFFKTPGDHGPKMNNPPLKELSLEEKIDFIITNEGSELGGGYYGLKNYIEYCIPTDDEKKVLDFLANYINYDYEFLEEELEAEKYEFAKEFKDLPVVCVVHDVDNLKENLIKVNETLFSVDGKSVVVKSGESYVINEEF